MSDTTKPRGVLAFLGFNKTSTAIAPALAATEAATTDDEDCDPEDEDEAAAEGEEAKAAVRARNALRAAGHRRGFAAANERLATVMNGVDPAKAEMGLHLALNSDMPADKIRAFLDKAPAGPAAATGFERVMARLAGEQPLPAAGGGDAGGGGKDPSLSGRMADLVAKTVGKK